LAGRGAPLKRVAHGALALAAKSPLGAKVALALGGVAAGSVAGLFVFLALFGAVLSGSASGQSVSCGLSERGRGEVPAELLPIYRSAAGRYRLGERGVAILAAINAVESDFGRNLGPSSAGAFGWMQFLPSTWRAYGVDADGDGRRDMADPDDAIHAAARYLRASGAPRDWYRAIFAYNHADWYVQKVQAQADRYQGTCTAVLDAGPAVAIGDLDFRDTAGPWGGSQKFARALAAVGRRLGCTSSSEKRPRKYTASGGISDHWVGSRDAYAIDINTGACTMSHPGGEADRTARAIAATLGLPRHTGTVSAVRGAYRFQLIWQDAGHYDHVHLGVRRIR
jgi:hypothetical protein